MKDTMTANDELCALRLENDALRKQISLTSALPSEDMMIWRMVFEENGPILRNSLEPEPNSTYICNFLDDALNPKIDMSSITNRQNSSWFQPSDILSSELMDFKAAMPADINVNHQALEDILCKIGSILEKKCSYNEQLCIKSLSSIAGRSLEYSKSFDFNLVENEKNEMKSIEKQMHKTIELFQSKPGLSKGDYAQGQHNLIEMAVRLQNAHCMIVSIISKAIKNFRDNIIFTIKSKVNEEVKNLIEQVSVEESKCVDDINECLKKEDELQSDKSL
eukprot:GHVL01009158.1.p1 GENE.GHVL01009158.1~~GHVL01009158.1.p1  ORF type:complete len:277 (-),score=41.86 GHVL01009158.1:1050-1880(-)